jgi:hypothetical protein
MSRSNVEQGDDTFVTTIKPGEGDVTQQIASLDTNGQTNPKASIDEQFFGTSLFESKINSTLKPAS